DRRRTGGDRAPGAGGAARAGFRREPAPGAAQRGYRAHRSRRAGRREGGARARAQAPAARHRREDQRELPPAAGRAPGADRDPAERRVGHLSRVRLEGRRADRTGRGGQQPDPAAGELAAARTRRVRVARHARTRPGAVPDPRGVGSARAAARPAAPGREAAGRAGAAHAPPGRDAKGGDAGRPAGAAASPGRATAVIGNLSRRERILVALALAVAVILGSWLLVVEPILEHNRSAAELVPAREQVLLQKRELLARRAAITVELEATTVRLDKLAEGFLTSATPAVAASELHKIVKDMAAQAKTEVRSERILPPTDRGKLLEIPV